MMAIDLELNQPSNRIIEIGYAVGDVLTHEIHQKGSFFVDPGEPLKRRDEDPCDIVELCNIWRELDGPAPKRVRVIPANASLIQAYNELRNVHEAFQCQPNPITWGGGDSQELRTELKWSGEEFGWVFGRRWIDVKTLALELLRAKGQNPSGGLSKTMTKFGLQFQGRKHQADDDALNTLELFFKINRLLNQIEDIKQ